MKSELEIMQKCDKVTRELMKTHRNKSMKEAVDSGIAKFVWGIWRDALLWVLEEGDAVNGKNP